MKRSPLNKNTATTSLYIHVPFCLKKCPYCDFFSVPVDSANIGSYADLLVRHLQVLSGQGESKSLESVFFGGGTPSLLSPGDIGRILDTAEEQFGFTEDIEISLEANPGTVDGGSLAGFRSAGVNRLSIGIQALCDRNLHLLGRPHSADEAEEAIHQARAAGFTNLSVDLMFALPGQPVAQLQDDLQRLLNHQPEHLAIYGLTFEAGTPFFDRLQSGRLQEPDEEIYVGGYRRIHETLSGAGYRHYEISNFARTGFACRHNRRYWERRDNLAIGAGGHSFREAGWGERWAVADDLERYRESLEDGRDPSERVERFDQAGAMFETLFLGLRTDRGIDDALFRARFGQAVAEAYPGAVEKCGRLLRNDNGNWRLNVDGWLLFNTLLAHFR